MRVLRARSRRPVEAWRGPRSPADFRPGRAFGTQPPAAANSRQPPGTSAGCAHPVGEAPAWSVWRVDSARGRDAMLVARGCSLRRLSRALASHADRPTERNVAHRSGATWLCTDRRVARRHPSASVLCLDVPARGLGAPNAPAFSGNRRQHCKKRRKSVGGVGGPMGRRPDRLGGRPGRWAFQPPAGVRRPASGTAGAAANDEMHAPR